VRTADYQDFFGPTLPQSVRQGVRPTGYAGIPEEIDTWILTVTFPDQLIGSGTLDPALWLLWSDDNQYETMSTLAFISTTQMQGEVPYGPDPGDFLYVQYLGGDPNFLYADGSPFPAWKKQNTGISIPP